jgi:protein-S-isoprenylcysteine O-methyltransferase Ste14
MNVLDRTMMILAVVVGILALVFFVCVWPAGLVDWHWPTRTALGFDALLSLAFFLQHSGMVRRSFRLWLARFTPARYGGAIYAMASGIVLTLVALLWQPSAVRVFSVSGTGAGLMRAAAVAALVVAAWGFRALRSADLFGCRAIESHLRGLPEPKTPFVVRWPYRWVRHPLYACALVVIWSNPEMTADRLLFAVLWSAWILAGTIWEERDLRVEFGEAYREYQQRVPMLIPWRGRAG